MRLRTLSALLALAPAALAQDESFQGKALFSLPRSQDDDHEWRTAKEELAAGKVTEAVERLHGLLESRRDGVVPVVEQLDHFLGLRAAVIETLRELPPEALAAYERLAAREGGALLRQALANSRPEDLLAVARSFPVADAGRLARLRLGDLELTAGRPREAMFHYRAARDATSRRHPQWASIERRYVLASALYQGERSGDQLTDDQRALVAQARASLPEADDPLRDHYGFAGRPPEPPRGRPKRNRTEQVEPTGFSANEYAMHAVGDTSGVFVCDGLRVLAIDPFSGLMWEGESPFLREGEDYREYEGQIDYNFALAPAVCGDVVVAALQVPSEGENSRFRSFEVIVKIPSRRLLAFDRATGKQLWAHYDRRGGPLAERFRGHDACGPPIIDGDTVYVASHDKTGAIAFYVAAYDLHTGEPRWRRLVCSSQLEVNMFGNARKEFAASPLALHGGVIYGSTNLGVCFAIDQADGGVRWVSAYTVTPMPTTRLTHQEERPVYFANNPVFIADGVMACTPLDSQYVVAFDCATGRMVWQMPYIARMSGDNNVRWLLGAIGDEFIVSGQGVLAVRARPRAPQLQPDVRLVRSRENLGVDPLMDLPPRGAVVGNRIYYPSPAGISVFDAHGTADPIVTALARLPRPGNLLLTDGMLVSVRSGAIDICYDVDSLLQHAERQVREHGDDAAAALRLAQLLRAQAGDNLEGGLADRAAEVLRRGLAACDQRGLARTDPLRNRIGGMLFDLALARGVSVSQREPARALAMLRRARDDAPDDDRWLEAQRRVLALVQPPHEACQEFDALAERMGDRVLRFDGGVELPATAYALWQCAERETAPARSVQRWQRLLEEYPDVRIDGIEARTMARLRIARVIEQHGRTVYAAVETRARDAFAAARGDTASLTAVVDRFPHASVTADALRAIMDLAVAATDLEAAVRCVRNAAERDADSPGLLRRLQATATAQGNHPLAAALAAHLRTAHGDTVSDFAADGGKRLRDLPAPDQPAPPAPLPPAPPVTHRVTHLTPSVPGSRLALFDLDMVPGFAASAAPPVFVWEGGTVLRAHDPVAGERAFPILYSIDSPRLVPTVPLLACGERLLVAENDRVRGFDLRTGRLFWTHLAAESRALYALGVADGVLVLFSEHDRAADGGVLLGLEPFTGALVFERRFGALEPSIAPVCSGDAICMLRPGKGEGVNFDRLDPLSGRTMARIELQPSSLEALGLGTQFTRQGALLRIHERLHVDADGIYLAADGVSESRRPAAIVALAHDGSTRWTWRGSPGRTLQHILYSSGHIGVVEAGPTSGGRVVILDRDGNETGRVDDIGRSVQLLSPRRPSSPALPGQDVLAVAGLHPGGWCLLCRSITAPRPAFRVNLPGDVNLSAPQDQPMFGDGFMIAAVALLSQNETLLVTYDVADGQERGRVRLPKAQVMGVRRAGPWVAVETTEGVTILGNQGSPLR